MPSPIRSILERPGPAGTLAAEARVLLRVEGRIHRLLGEASVPHLRAAGLSGRSLTILADSPAWASIVRFKAPEIRAAARRDVSHLRHVRVVVADAETPSRPRPAPPRRTLSPSAVRVLRSGARTIDNPPLARVLARIAECNLPRADRPRRSSDLNRR